LFYNFAQYKAPFKAGYRHKAYKQDVFNKSLSAALSGVKKLLFRQKNTPV
jgi:hypothetical protein